MTLLASHRDWRNNSLKKPNYQEMTVSFSWYRTKSVVKKCITILFTEYLPCTQTSTSQVQPHDDLQEGQILCMFDQDWHKDGWSLDSSTITVANYCRKKFNSTFFSHALVDYIILYRLRIWVWERGNEGARKSDEQGRTREGRTKTCNDVARFTTHVSQTC